MISDAAELLQENAKQVNQLPTSVELSKKSKHEQQLGTSRQFGLQWNI